MFKTDDPVWTVSALNFEIKTLLEQGIGSIWLEGEISNFSSPASGHWYFSLKDEQSQLRAAMFKNRNTKIGFRPQNGQQVLIRAQVTLYQARGEFQVIVEHLEEAGAGLLMKRFEALKNSLNQQGLFDSQHKRDIPAIASHIGIITSSTGAAIHDALSVIKRRSPLTHVTIYPTQVQGEQATPHIVKALQTANQRSECDVLLLIRGGGSIEDLWCFNEEAVARAIYASEIPVISGIGHEVDVTIADFVADLRAPTPSVAAEKVTRDQYEWMSQVDQFSQRLNRARQHQFRRHRDRLSRLQEQLLSHHPKQYIKMLSKELVQTQARLYRSMQLQLRQARQKTQMGWQQLRFHAPDKRILADATRVDFLRSRLIGDTRNRMQHHSYQVQTLARSLDNLSPLKTLARGYAVISKHGNALHSIQQLESEDRITIQMRDGRADATVKAIKPA